MAEREALVSQVREVAGVPEEAALALLEATSWSLEDALALHFASDQHPTDGSPPAPFVADPYGPGPAGVAVATERWPAPQPRPAPAAAVAAAVPSEDGSSVSSRDSAAAAAVAAPAEAAVVDGRQAATAGSSWPVWSSIGGALTRVSQLVFGIPPEDFEAWFAGRFGAPTPAFSKDCFGDAVKGALRDGRLLLLWFHQEETPASDAFCRNVLQNSLVMELLHRSYLLWGGDVNRFEPAQIARLLSATVFPTLVICRPIRSVDTALAMERYCIEWPLGTFAQPLFLLSPQAPGQELSADEAIVALTTAAEDHEDVVAARAVEAERRAIQMAQERILREEQDREFEAALLADQLAEVAAAASASAAASPASAASSGAPPAPQQLACPEAAPAAAPDRPGQDPAEEARRQARAAELLAEPEPAPGETAVARISLRLPAGERLQRVFLSSRRLEEVYEWAHCCRPRPDPPRFELCTTFPARRLTERSATLEELGLCPNAALLLKAVDE